ncbi:hypothetical protein SAMN02927921_00806 [Sinomicrobium oceani]|uniref:Uncharacterized protein n=1 Tax=Sinomicrobium oceani TaxID=1150368 RepID=A0A1K1MT28_9FLAO|nr:hypothetical protein [Sinomicrobium oceani]SFW26267.1 hypothetical protein SAMN02927921_00806 [Sinomicrobium oceani]
MTTLIIAISFLGFYALYNTSRRAVLSKSLGIERWMQAHRAQSKTAGLLLLVLGMVLSVIYYGLGAGIFAFVVILMTIGSLIVLIAPLRFVRYQVLFLVLVLSVTFEFL